MEGLQKAQSRNLAVEELADTAAWSSFTSQPESGVLWVGGYSCIQKIKHFCSRHMTCCDTAPMVWKVKSFSQMDEFQVFPNALGR